MLRKQQQAEARTSPKMPDRPIPPRWIRLVKSGVDLIQLCCCLAVSRTWIKLLFSLDWYQHRGVLVLHQKREELSRFRGACVAANYMNIIGTFIKALAWRERDFFAAFH